MKRAVVSRDSLIHTLVEEHVHIKTGLLILDAMRKRIARRHALPLGDLSSVVRFFAEYADRIHHHSEEELLFPVIEKSPNQRLRRMLGKLATQHLMGRLFVGAMKAAVSNARAQRRGWRSSFVENAQAFHTLLTIHICDEDHLFFPMAERVLTRRKRTASGEWTEQPALKKRWQNRIERLSGKYCPTTPDRSRSSLRPQLQMSCQTAGSRQSE